jgi:transposase InsO family protein
MRELGLEGRRKRRFRATTDSRHRFPVAPNVLMRNFDVETPNTAWVTDITYVATLEGWLYLAVILDLYSRRVVGYALSERIDRALVLEALREALLRRPGARDLVHHSDRGSQYASHDYRDALDQAGITCSMSRRGNCWDNAVAESFFGTLKTELLYELPLQTNKATRHAVADYIDSFYNVRRRHSSLDYQSPVEFELKNGGARGGGGGRPPPPHHNSGTSVLERGGVARDDAGCQTASSERRRRDIFLAWGVSPRNRKINPKVSP